MNKFPKQERIVFLLRKDLADKIPKENPERRKFLNSAVEHELETENKQPEKPITAQTFYG